MILNRRLFLTLKSWKIFIPAISTFSDTANEDIEALLKKDCVAIKNGVVFNDITAMTYVLWEEVKKLKQEIKLLTSGN